MSLHGFGKLGRILQVQSRLGRMDKRNQADGEDSAQRKVGAHKSNTDDEHRQVTMALLMGASVEGVTKASSSLPKRTVMFFIGVQLAYDKKATTKR